MHTHEGLAITATTLLYDFIQELIFQAPLYEFVYILVDSSVVYLIYYYILSTQNVGFVGKLPLNE